jgi:glycerol uptake facilitator-like aquaporin
MEEKQAKCPDNFTFIKALIAVLLGAVLVNLWIRVINNFTYHTLKLSQDSTFWAIIIAVIATSFLVIYIIFVLDNDTSLQLRQNMTGVSFVAAPNITTQMNYNDNSQ